MSQDSLTNKDTIVNLVELYLSKWKLIAFCLLIALAAAFVKIRYSTFMYQANATIKLKEDENSRSLSEISSLQNGGLSSTLPNVVDEIEVIKSRSILTQVVKDLKLNISYYVSGKVKKEEIYSNPPVDINFFLSDSVLADVHKSLYIKIISAQQYELSKVNTNKLLEFDDGETTTHSFGDRVKGSFGDFVITPNIDAYGSQPGSFIEIHIRPIHSVVEAYLSKVKIGTTDKSNVIKLSLNESIKEKARLILDEVIKKYNADVINDKELIVKATSDFITNRLNVVSNELEQVDFTAEKLQKDNRLTALSSQSNIFLESERQTEAKINQTSNQLQLVEFMSDRLNNNDSGTDLLPADIGITDSNVAQITQNHNNLVLQRDRILKNSSDKNPTVIKLNDQINALKNNLNQSLSNIKDANQITLNNLNREDSRIRGQIYSAPGKERQFRDIKRQQDIKESLYLYLLEKREETAITLGMSTANAKVIDYAYTNDDPVAPKKKIIYLTAILIGLIIPVSFIYAKDLIDTKVHSKEDVLRLVKAPFIGDIPKADTKTKVVNKVDYSPKAEAFRIIRTNVNFMLQKVDKKCKTVFVTSTTAQEGKSHTTTNLASSFSFSEKKTLLIETDIRVPRVNDYLKIKSDKGLTDFISDKSLNIKDVTVSVKDNEFLDVIPSGTIPPNPAELLMSDRIKYLFENVKEQYDYIIVDTAAVGLVTDTLLISDHADIFIYVISANNIDKRQLHIAQTMYEEKRLPRMVTLLNGTVKKKGYGYGYGNNPTRKKKWYKPF
ncbi:polysaccharide biosynthesis tyrosine autokinase [uncultured Psychroserpens sp.]|uniref:GumC family protein n=1 Tax=uncultured Psychroserpens sp. TaxID=255436 RepID=UPI002630CD0C|nr:polysaccharide biosynthesis tyrosine autokinase [uncultured Psychroserpens sp.]